MILVSLPTTKKFHALLTIGKDYEIYETVGNGVIIQPDSGDERIIILASRLVEQTSPARARV